MKKLLSLVFGLIVFMSLILVSSTATADDQLDYSVYRSNYINNNILPIGITFIAGNITDFDGDAVSNADVFVVCHHNSVDNIESTQSSFKGKYIVFFPEQKCGVGDLVEVNVVKDDMSGTASGVVEKWDKFIGVIFNVNAARINVTIPEFGLITGSLALIGSGVGFLFLRKRKNQNN